MGSTLNTLVLDSTFEAIEEIASDKDHVWVRVRRKDDGTPWSLEMSVCETLAAVHEKGIIHKDINPDHIFYDPTTGARYISSISGSRGESGRSPPAGSQRSLSKGRSPMSRPSRAGAPGVPSAARVICIRSGSHCTSS